MALPLHHVTAEAVTPDQLLPYVHAVSPMQSRMAGDCVLHTHQDRAVLVGYPLRDPHNTEALKNSLNQTLSLPGLTHLTVIAAARPASAPPEATTQEDHYWAVPLPPPTPRQKLRNMLHRASRDITYSTDSGPGCWTPEHSALVLNYIRTRHLEPGTRHIFTHLGQYLTAARDALLFSAHDSQGHLVGCAIGDYSSLATAFYMFAFRAPTAPPGTADFLLATVLNEGSERGHSHCNLGLGINPRIAFFKKKWQAQAFLPCVQTDWTVGQEKKGWLKKIFGG